MRNLRTPTSRDAVLARQQPRLIIAKTLSMDATVFENPPLNDKMSSDVILELLSSSDEPTSKTPTERTESETVLKDLNSICDWEYLMQFPLPTSFVRCYVPILHLN